ncbi:MAG: methyltransferase domain-containing protein [Gammaproteobacteria bacterium]|nr:methyltransferase domain-containing protein [Gammaproteobacteria bacterium]
MPLAPPESHAYTRRLHPDGQDSLAKIARLIAPHAVVLDLGAGPGALGQYLSTAKQCTMDGVEYDPAQAQTAAPFYRNLQVADLEQADLTKIFAGQQYDYIVCADVLEHLRNPGHVVDQLPDLLKPDGRILLSIPNVAHAGLIADLLAGEFRYGPEGLLDETHVRFFTRKSLLEFLRQHRLRALSLDTVNIDIRASEFRARHIDALPPKLYRYLRAQPDALTYQFIVEAAPADWIAQLPDLPATITPQPELHFACQLYWNTRDNDYREENSLTSLAQIGNDRQLIELALPSLNEELTGLRFDPADRPGFLHIHSLSLVGQNGEIVWAWDGERATLEQSRHRQMAFADSWAKRFGVTALLTGEDPSIELPVSPGQLSKLREGGSLRVEISWPMSSDYMALAQRILNPDAQLQRMTAMRAELNIFKEEKAELENIINQLRSAQENLEQERNSLNAQLNTLATQYHALEAQHEQLTGEHARQRSEIEQIRQALSEIHASRIWRYSRPYVRLMTSLKASLRRFAPTVAPMPGATPTSNIRSSSPAQPRSEAVDIIIPVFRGLEETKRCIDSVLSSATTTSHEIIVINDASPEPDLVNHLKELATAGTITLLHNEQNLGFVGTVNRGMLLNPERDGVLLNSDTEVANDWLDRLRRCAYSEGNIATVTPFSNNATLCSYPKICEDNALPASYDVKQLDTLFSKINRGKSLDIPTAVGFCMYIRRDSLDDVGLFDAKHFGKGYGEENDFSLRAANKGWRNVLCADTFVYHAGGVSFTDSGNPRKTQAMDVMRRLHPHYEMQVHAHIQQDPARPLRLAVDMVRLRQDPTPLLLFITHDRAGGTEKHIQELVRLLAGSARVLLLRPCADGQTELSCLSGNEDFHLFFDIEQDYPELLNVLRALQIRRIHFHHTLAIHPRLFELPNDLGVAYDFTAHDYYSACPQVSMSNLRNSYCGEPDEDGCNRCLKFAPAPGNVGIHTWRGRHAELLEHAERVFTPSLDVARRLSRYFPSARFVLSPHPEDDSDNYPVPAPPPLASAEALRIVVLGALSPLKGPDILESCALDAKRRGLPLEFHLIGYAYRSLVTAPRSNLTVTGPYTHEELPNLLARANPHLAWFPAQVPETYSYTLSECLRAGLPAVCPNLGAFSERLAGRAWSWIRPWDWSAEKWNEFFITARTEHFLTGAVPKALAGEPVTADFSYQSDYLVASSSPIPDTETREHPETDISLQKFAYPKSHHTPSHASAAKGKLLQLIIVLRSAPLLRSVAKRIPVPWQTRVKTWLLGH